LKKKRLLAKCKMNHIVLQVRFYTILLIIDPLDYEILYFLRPEIKGALGLFCTLKIQILGKGIAPLMVIGKIKLEIFPRFGRL
jgi:hypothetical protein